MMYPEWRRRQCPRCAADMPMSSRDGYHWTGNSNPPKCEAKSPDQHIKDLEAQIEHLCAEIERLNAIVDQVDDILVLNRIDVKDEDIGMALRDLMRRTIQIEKGTITLTPLPTRKCGY